jgi:hypothetical protein
VEVEWRAWLDSGTLPVGQIVQRDPFGDGSAIRANRDGDISEGPAGRVHPFGVDERGLARKPALAQIGAPDNAVERLRGQDLNSLGQLRVRIVNGRRRPAPQITTADVRSNAQSLLGAAEKTRLVWQKTSPDCLSLSL